MRTLEQERMARAYEFVRDAKTSGVAKEYKSLAQKLPSMITGNGLLTTLAFLKSKAKKEKGKKNAHLILLEQFCDYMAERFSLNSEEDRYESLKERLLGAEVDEYLYMSREALNFAVWLKRIAEGEIDEDRGSQ
jgi:CRISPR-associated protein Cmr5